MTLTGASSLGEFVNPTVFWNEADLVSSMQAAETGPARVCLRVLHDHVAEVHMRDVLDLHLALTPSRLEPGASRQEEGQILKKTRVSIRCRVASIHPAKEIHMLGHY